MRQMLADAISNLKTVKLFYPPGERLVEPHTLGYNSSGDLMLRAFQIDGASASGEHENWKLFRLDRMAKVECSDTPSGAPRSGYRRGDKAMKGGIIAQL